MITIGLSVTESGRPHVWSMNVSDSLLDVARASKDPSVFKDIFSLLSATAVGVCMNPNAVPPGEATPL